MTMSPCRTPAASISPFATTCVVHVSDSTGSRAYAAAVVASFAFDAGVNMRPSFKPNSGWPSRVVTLIPKSAWLSAGSARMAWMRWASVPFRRGSRTRARRRGMRGRTRLACEPDRRDEKQRSRKRQISPNDKHGGSLAGQNWRWRQHPRRRPLLESKEYRAPTVRIAEASFAKFHHPHELELETAHAHA